MWTMDTDDVRDKGKEKQKEDTDTGDADKQAAVKQEDEDIAAEGDPTASLQNLQPNIPKDYELFLNLVEFCKMVLLVESTKAKEGHAGSTPVKTEPSGADQAAAAIKEEDGQKEGTLTLLSHPTHASAC
jgi:hypothetical protein